ncbi:MAG TPA: hypothetical protein PLK34_01220 [Candidatus Pacearchaeota archaeon]|nr:hypothetical protein [Candidatus Pacearchaeota archaeon]
MEKNQESTSNISELEKKASEHFKKFEAGSNSRGGTPKEVSNSSLVGYIKDFMNITAAVYYQNLEIIQQNRKLLKEMEAYKDLAKTVQYISTNLKL